YYVPTNTIPTDLDTYIQGPTASGLSNTDPANFGPYRLSQVGGSSFQYLGSGIWRFQTATGGTEEWVSGALKAGLNQIQVRTTVFNGRQVDEPFNGEAGQVSVNPYPVGTTDCDAQGSLTVNISSTLSIPSIQTFAAGLSQPVTTTEEISLNETKYFTFTLTNPGVLDVRTRTGGSNPASDVDLRVQKNINGVWTTIGASEGGTSDENIRITLPGAGQYRARVFGYAVANSPGTFILAFHNIDGTGLQVVSAPASLSPGESASIQLAYNQSLAPGTYNGVLFVGPQGAVGAIMLPVTVTVTGDCPEPPTCDIEFQDVPPSTAVTSFYPYVSCLACRNIIGGYPCGDVNPVSGQAEPCGSTGNAYYRPDNLITRGQIAKIVAQSAGYDTEPGPQIYADVPPEQVFWIYVQQLSNDGIMGGYPCGGVNPLTGDDEECDDQDRPYFRVNNPATRGQISKIVANAAGLTYTGSAQTYQDVPPSTSPNSFYPYIEALTAMGVMGGYPCGNTDPRSGPCVAPNNRPYFRPELNVTRGQAAKIVSNTFFPNCETSGGAKP
ncbi:MAG: S-layer homology domain-containing protein, partial [Chloroflexota bacterium]|nr:S-layer homology domain-containing protein [Chloroflexota bacterium]